MKRKPYDPVAYQAELDARCNKAGAAWMPAKRRGAAGLPEDQLQAHLDSRRELNQLRLPVGDELDSREDRRRASGGWRKRPDT